MQQIFSLVRKVESAVQGDLNLDWIKSLTTNRFAKAGEILFRKGDVADKMMFVVSGHLGILELGIELGEGQIIGELGLLAPKKVRTQTIECVTDVELLEITYDQVKQLYFQSPKFGFFFLQLASRRLFENLERQDREIAAYRVAETRPA